MSLIVDSDKSRVRIRTFAEGLFSRLAHDLELVCSGITGDGEGNQTGTEGTAKLTFPIARINVSGTLKDGRIDEGGLSSSDRQDCLEKMRKDVFHTHSPSADVRVDVTLEGKTAHLTIVPPNGKTVAKSIDNIRVTNEDDTVRVSGSLPLSLSALGSDTVKGPMNAFRVKDQIEVLFDIVLMMRAKES